MCAIWIFTFEAHPTPPVVSILPLATRLEPDEASEVLRAQRGELQGAPGPGEHRADLVREAADQAAWPLDGLRDEGLRDFLVGGRPAARLESNRRGEI